MVFGYNSVVAVRLHTMVVASIVGVWLFSVQHRFDGAQWALPRLIGSFAEAALKSASAACTCPACFNGSPAISAFTTYTI